MPKKNAKTHPGMYGKEALAKKAAEKFHDRGSKWAIDNGDFLESVTVGVLDKALAGQLKYCNGERRDDELLTEEETKKLIAWIAGSAKNTNPCSDREISDKVIDRHVALPLGVQQEEAPLQGRGLRAAHGRGDAAHP